jgi:prepilin-type N-terminal cleavage/methylation domain-containing protein
MKNKADAFTLIEVLIYVAILSIILLIVAGFLLWSGRSNTKAKVINETTYNARRAIEIVSHEAKEAIGVYVPTSLFADPSGQLSLETLNYLPPGETTTYIDFYLCSDQICLKKENQDPISITSNNIIINRLEFNQIATTSVQISITADYKTSSGKDEYQTSVNVTSTAALRTY